MNNIWVLDWSNHQNHCLVSLFSICRYLILRLSLWHLSLEVTMEGIQLLGYVDGDILRMFEMLVTKLHDQVKEGGSERQTMWTSFVHSLIMVSHGWTNASNNITWPSSFWGINAWVQASSINHVCITVRAFSDQSPSSFVSAAVDCFLFFWVCLSLCLVSFSYLFL